MWESPNCWRVSNNMLYACSLFSTTVSNHNLPACLYALTYSVRAGWVSSSGFCVVVCSGSWGFEWGPGWGPRLGHRWGPGWGPCWCLVSGYWALVLAGFLREVPVLLLQPAGLVTCLTFGLTWTCDSLSGFFHVQPVLAVLSVTACDLLLLLWVNISAAGECCCSHAFRTLCLASTCSLLGSHFLQLNLDNLFYYLSSFVLYCSN